MNRPKQLMYNSAVVAVRLYQKLFLDLHVWGREHIPPGPKIYVTNHITTTDPYWVLPVFTEPVHVIIGPGYKSKWLARVLDYLEQINALPQHRKAVVDQAVRYLERGESVYTAPEGDLCPTFQLGRFYPGVAKIYRRIQVPIIPIALLAPRHAMKERPSLEINVDGRTYRAVTVMRGPYAIHVGRPFWPELRATADEAADNLRIMEDLKARLQALINEIRVDRFWL